MADDTNATPTGGFPALRSAASDAPHAPAILGVDGQVLLTRGGLNDCLNQGAAALGQMGVSPRMRVAVLTPRGPVTVAAFLSLAAHVPVAPLPVQGRAALWADILRLGVGLVVGNPADTAPVEDDLRRAGIGLLHVTGKIETGTLSLTWRAHLPIRATGDGAQVTPLPPLPPAGADDIAVLLQTSGTTGAPKTVALAHRQIAHMTHWGGVALALGSDDICVNPMPMHHVHGIAINTFLPLANGGATVPLADPGGGSILAAITACAATWYSGAPTVHQDVLRALEAGADVAGHRLRLIRSSSSALAEATRAGLEHRLGVPVLEGLGMTEAVSWVLQQPYGTAPEHGNVGAGHGVVVAVLTDAGIARGPGSEGQLIVRGGNVITGYADAPDGSETAFADGWLKSGDLVRLNDDGSVSVIGRLKELINRGGAVVPPVLVEDQLLEHSDVSQAIAFGVSHPTLDQDLIAGVVPRPGSAPDPLQLRLWLAERVAPERVPRQILLLDSIPLNAIGKPERRLAGDILKDRLNGNAGAAATGPVQGILAEIMGDLLARAPLAQAEDFFWAGGDSLMLMRLQLQIEEIFGVILPTDDIALAPTIDRIEPLIAARIEAARMAAIDAAWQDAED